MLQARDPKAVIDMARDHTRKAFATIVSIMEDEEAPVAIRERCAEFVIERGYGKAPQAVLVDVNDSTGGGLTTLSVAERILALRQAKDRGSTPIELENSEATEVEALPAPSVATPAPQPTPAPAREGEDLL